MLLTNPTCQPMDHQHWCFAHPMGHSMGPQLLSCFVHVFFVFLLVVVHHPMGHSMDPQCVAAPGSVVEAPFLATWLFAQFPLAWSTKSSANPGRVGCIGVIVTRSGFATLLSFALQLPS